MKLNKIAKTHFYYKCHSRYLFPVCRMASFSVIVCHLCSYIASIALESGCYAINQSGANTPIGLGLLCVLCNGSISFFDLLDLLTRPAIKSNLISDPLLSHFYFFSFTCDVSI